MKKKLNLGTQVRAAEFSPQSIDKDNRTVDLVWSTGARVLRRDWDGDPYYEELSMDPAHIRMSRLNSGAPLLGVHNQWSLGDVLGVVDNARIENGSGIAKVRFSKRSEVDSVMQDVADGILRNVSVGYRTLKVEKYREANSDIPVYRAIDWEPYEISLVPVGADAGAGTRAASEQSYPCEIVERAEGAIKGNLMPENDTRTAIPAATTEVTPAVPTVAVEAARKEGVESERKRVNEIGLAVRTAKLPEAFAAGLVEKGVSIDAARALIIEEWSKQVPPPGVGVRVEAGSQDESATRNLSIESAILHRFDPKKFKAEHNARSYVNLSFLEIARELLEAKGEKTRGYSKMELAGRAITTSDLPGIVANVANKSLRDAYESAPQTFRPFTREAELPDFKPVSRTQLGDAPQLEPVGEDGEIKRGSISDGVESYKLGTFAKILPITRQTIINDDMGAITRIPMLFGRAAADLESDLLYALFSANGGLGQTLMVDSTAVFNAAKHKNLAATGAVISVAAIGAGRAAMRQQKNLQGRPINVTPKFLLVPTAIETLADQFVTTAMLANQPSATNPFAGRLQVLSEPRLDAVSATAWYLMAEYGQIDICEIAYLQGQKGVFFETRQGFDVEGLEFKARLDIGVKFIDYRGVYKNPGA